MSAFIISMPLNHAKNEDLYERGGRRNVGDVYSGIIAAPPPRRAKFRRSGRDVIRASKLSNRVEMVERLSSKYCLNSSGPTAPAALHSVDMFRGRLP